MHIFEILMVKYIDIRNKMQGAEPLPSKLLILRYVESDGRTLREIVNIKLHVC